MKTIQMNKPNQIRFIYQILKDAVSNRYDDFELIEYANSLHELFHEEYEDGFVYLPAYEEKNIKDAFSLISSKNGELMYQERELLNCVYEFESDEFITNKPWSKRYLGDGYEC